MPASPTLLAFDTSGPFCAAALYHRGQMTTRTDDMAKGQAEHLMPMLQEMLDARGLGFSDLHGVGVGIGPGNFTGIRISVSAARGLALGLGKPAIGVSRLEALAFGVARPVVVVEDARHNRVYAQYFGKTEATSPVLLDLINDNMPSAWKTERPVLIGSGAEALAKLTGSPVEMSPAPLAEAIARIALTRLDAPYTPPAPLYLRPADAAPARDMAPVILD